MDLAINEKEKDNTKEHSGNISGRPNYSDATSFPDIRWKRGSFGNNRNRICLCIGLGSIPSEEFVVGCKDNDRKVTKENTMVFPRLLPSVYDGAPRRSLMVPQVTIGQKMWIGGVSSGFAQDNSVWRA
jgi:hypothetical protein